MSEAQAIKTVWSHTISWRRYSDWGRQLNKEALVASAGVCGIDKVARVCAHVMHTGYSWPQGEWGRQPAHQQVSTFKCVSAHLHVGGSWCPFYNNDLVSMQTETIYDSFLCVCVYIGAYLRLT